MLRVLARDRMQLQAQLEIRWQVRRESSSSMKLLVNDSMVSIEYFRLTFIVLIASCASPIEFIGMYSTT